MKKNEKTPMSTRMRGILHAGFLFGFLLLLEFGCVALANLAPSAFRLPVGFLLLIGSWFLWRGTIRRWMGALFSSILLRDLDAPRFLRTIADCFSLNFGPMTCLSAAFYTGDFDALSSVREAQLKTQKNPATRLMLCSYLMDSALIRGDAPSVAALLPECRQNLAAAKRSAAKNRFASLLPMYEAFCAGDAAGARDAYLTAAAAFPDVSPFGQVTRRFWTALLTYRAGETQAALDQFREIAADAPDLWYGAEAQRILNGEAAPAAPLTQIDLIAAMKASERRWKRFVGIFVVLFLAVNLLVALAPMLRSLLFH